MSVHIQTQRLVLKPFSLHDKDALLALLTNDRIKQTYMIPDFPSLEQAERMFHRFQELSLAEDR
ncbi:MAG: GNAT family N-acetyltransferase, partial [Firmicutes bacterium]|nr:GNAT family N-acetyltransferase [Bacillota bacterium]